MRSISLDESVAEVNLVVDRSKGEKGIRIFNTAIRSHIEGRLHPIVPFHIHHHESHTNAGLQAVDMFGYGFFEKYEREDTSWYEVFQQCIRREIVFDTKKERA